MGIKNIFDSDAQQTEHDVSRFTTNPSFNPTTKANDIAVLYLRRNRNNRTKILEIETDELLVGIKCYVSGWGKDNEDYMNNNIHSAEVAIANISSDGFIHTTFTREGQSGCSVDVGSPLICNGKVAGIAVKDIGCDSGNHTVFINVEKNKNWIKPLIN